MAHLLTASDLRAAGAAFIVPVTAPIFEDCFYDGPTRTKVRQLKVRRFRSPQECVNWLEHVATHDIDGKHLSNRCPIFAYEPTPEHLAEIRLSEGSSSSGVITRVGFGEPFNLLERIALEVAIAEALDRGTPTPEPPTSLASDRA